MKLIMFDGLYPTNPLFSLNIILVIFFEISVMIAEYIIVSRILEKETKNRRLIAVAVIASNIATFILGFLIQLIMESY